MLKINRQYTNSNTKISDTTNKIQQIQKHIDTFGFQLFDVLIHSNFDGFDNFFDSFDQKSWKLVFKIYQTATNPSIFIDEDIIFFI